jgi:hypothetical protein
MEGTKARAKMRQTFPRIIERFEVTVNAYDTRPGRCFENGLAMPAQPERAINEKPAATRVEQLDCLL